MINQTINRASESANHSNETLQVILCLTNCHFRLLHIPHFVGSSIAVTRYHGLKDKTWKNCKRLQKTIIPQFYLLNGCRNFNAVQIAVPRFPGFPSARWNNLKDTVHATNHGEGNRKISQYSFLPDQINQSINWTKSIENQAIKRGQPR